MIPLVGRVDERRRLQAALTRAAGGRGGAAFLVGEPGIGKTRLAQEVIALARQDGFVTLVGRAHALEANLAYAPLLEAIGSYLRSLDASRRDALVRELPDLGRLFAGLDLPPPMPLGDSGLEKTRLFDAVARLLERVAARAPILLFVDDLHSADRSSLELLQYLSRGLDVQKLLFLATLRESEADVASLRPLLLHLRRLGALEEIHLPRFAAIDIATLARDLLAAEPPPDLLVILQQRSAGTPLFVEMILGTLVDAGRLRRSEHGWTLEPGANPDLPPLVRDVIGERLARLDPVARRFLDLLAVSGEPTEHAVLRDALGIDDDALVELLIRGRSLGLVVEERSGADVAYSLHHPLIGEVAYAELAEVARRRAHLVVALALERHQPENLDRLAYHYRAAGSEADRERAFELLFAAGERARDAYANEEAARHFAAALDLARAGRQTDALPRTLERLGEAWERVRERGAAISVWEEALSLYERVNDVNALARLRRALALAEYDRGNVDAARTHLAVGVKALEGHPPSAELVDLQLARAVIHLRVLDLDEARKAATELAALAESLHSPRVASIAYLAQARVQDVCGPLLGARESFRRALAAAEVSGDDRLAQAIHDQLAVNAFSTGQPSLAREHAVRSLELARRLGAPALEANALGRRAWCEFLAGSWDQSLGFAADALAIARRVSHPRALGMALVGRTLVLAGRGDLDEARMCLAEIRATLGKGLSGYYASLIQAIEVLVALERGDAERTPIPAGDPNTFPVLRAGLPYGLAVLGEALVARGELTPAFGIVRDLDSVAAEGVPYFSALARHLEGLAHKSLGANAEARVQLGQAADLFGALEIPFEHARARLVWASVSDGNGEAVAAARGSLATFERLGARLYADRARRVLRQLGVRVEPARRPGPGGGPLSRRELEVARLVAEGLTTAEVAERLIISPLTASTHLHRMYERLGIGSRAALTRFLAEAGLL